MLLFCLHVTFHAGERYQSFGADVQLEIMKASMSVHNPGGCMLDISTHYTLCVRM